MTVQALRTPPPAQEVGLAPFKIVHRLRNGTPRVVELAGELWEPVRGKDAEELKEHMRLFEIDQRLEALLGGPDSEGYRLLEEAVDIREKRESDTQLEMWRDIGAAIVDYGDPHLWRALFCQFAHEYGLSAIVGGGPNAEWRFLLGDSGWTETAKMFGLPVTPELAESDERS